MVWDCSALQQQCLGVPPRPCPGMSCSENAPLTRDMTWRTTAACRTMLAVYLDAALSAGCSRRISSDGNISGIFSCENIRLRIFFVVEAGWFFSASSREQVDADFQIGSWYIGWFFCSKIFVLDYSLFSESLVLSDSLVR